MGHRLALSSVIAALAILAIAGTASKGGAGRIVGADEAQAATAHAASAPGSRLAAITRARMNRLRAAHGLGRLRYSRSLTHSADRQARYMAYHGFGHLSTIRASRAFRHLAEIILMHRGSHGQPATAIGGWLSSTPHRDIMLNGRYSAVGIGIFSRGGVTYWAAHLGRR